MAELGDASGQRHAGACASRPGEDELLVLEVSAGRRRRRSRSRARSQPTRPARAIDWPALPAVDLGAPRRC